MRRSREGGLAPGEGVGPAEEAAMNLSADTRRELEQIAREGDSRDRRMASALLDAAEESDA